MLISPEIDLGAAVVVTGKAPRPEPPRDTLLEFAINRLRPSVQAEAKALNAYDLMQRTLAEQQSVLFELDGDPHPEGKRGLRSQFRAKQQQKAIASQHKRTGDALPSMSNHHARLERRALELEAKLSILREIAEEESARLAAEHRQAEAHNAAAEEAKLLAQFRREEAEVAAKAERKRFTAWLEKKGHI